MCACGSLELEASAFARTVMHADGGRELEASAFARTVMRADVDVAWSNWLVASVDSARRC